MNAFLIIVLVVVAGTVCAALGYLFARHRAESESRDLRDAQGRLQTDRRVAEEQRDQARAQAAELRRERDEAQTSQREREASATEQGTRLAAAFGRIGTLEAELDTAREHHRQATADVEGLRKSLEAGRQRTHDLEGDLATAGSEKAALAAVTEELKQRIHGFETDLAKLRTERAELVKRQTEVAAAQEQFEQMREEHARLQTDQVKATVSTMLAESQEKLTATADERLGATAKPVTERLQALELHLREFDGRRTSTETRLDEQIKNLTAENARGRAQTEALVKALRKPQVRGQWGELQLKRAVEMANLRERCDFDLQVTVTGEERSQRPDMVVNLTNGRRIVVDAKVSLDAFMNAVEAVGDADHDRFMVDHAAQVRKHVDSLAAKEYFEKVAGSPDFVLMFLPNEALLQAALDKEPGLYEHALGKKIIIATPTVLIPMLRTIALSWDEKSMRENTETIHELGREIYNRLAKVGEYLEKLRGSLGSSVKHYNEAIGSLEGRALATAREFTKLGIRPSKELPELKPVERRPRELAAPEWVASATTEVAIINPGGDAPEPEPLG